MAALSRRLQTQGLRPYRPQQPLPVHGNEKPKLQTSSLGLRALLLLLLHQLSMG